MTPAEITRAREDLGLTQRALAEHLGVAPNTVWRWEQGKTVPSPHLMQAFETMMERPEDAFKAALQAWLLPTDVVTVNPGSVGYDVLEVRIKRTYTMLIPVTSAAIADPDAHQSMADHIARRFNESFRAAMEQPT